MKEDDNYKNTLNAEDSESVNLKNASEAINQFIKIIDIDNLSQEDLLRIVVTVGSKNMAYYLALIVNLENRSRKISPLGIAKVLSSKSVDAPNSTPIKTSISMDSIARNNDLKK
jgi:hypothetical protein